MGGGGNTGQGRSNERSHTSRGGGSVGSKWQDRGYLVEVTEAGEGAVTGDHTAGTWVSEVKPHRDTGSQDRETIPGLALCQVSA